MRASARVGPGVVVRTAAVQAFLLLFCWGILGILNARGTWLLADPQVAKAVTLFRLPLPLLGLAGAVLLPSLFALLLLRETREAGLLDAEFVVRALKLPSRAALCGLFVSVLAFNVAAFELRRGVAIPAIEAAKISALGLLTGTLLAVLSYFALQPVVRPLIDEALERGAVSPGVPTFPIRKKVLACSLAVAAIMAGLFGLEAFSWAQRSVEQEAMSDGREFVSALAAEARTKTPQSAAAWKALLKSRAHPAGSTVYVIGSSWNVLANDPDPVLGIERFLMATRFFAAAPDVQNRKAFVTRWGDVRVVAQVPVTDFATIGIILRPDPTALRSVLRSFLVVGLEALAAALLLAWAAAWGITRPIRQLQEHLETFAAEPDAAAPLPLVTDDEIAGLWGSFLQLETAVREAKERVARLSRRTEREAVLARMAHEIRNPLFGIQSTLSALEMQIGSGTHTEYFGVLRNETSRISRLIDQMLVEAAGKEEPALSLSNIVANAERLLDARLPGAELRVRWRENSPDMEIPLERESAIALLADLFEALIATNPQAREAEVAHISSDDGSTLVIRQCAAGPRVGSESASPVPRDGAGLLESCRERAVAHGGTLSVSSDGAEMTVLELHFASPEATRNT